MLVSWVFRRIFALPPRMLSQRFKVRWGGGQRGQHHPEVATLSSQSGSLSWGLFSTLNFRWNGKQKNHFKRGPPWKFPLDESMRLSLTCSIWMHLAGTHSFWKSLRAAVMFGIVRWPCVPCKEDPNFPMWVTISKGMDQAWSCRFWLPNCSGDWTGNSVENIHVPRIRAVKYIHTHTPVGKSQRHCRKQPPLKVRIEATCWVGKAR